MYYIYKIENLINHKKYIGLTNNIKRRRNRHFSDLEGNRHCNSFLKLFNIKSKNTFHAILRKESYQDCWYDFERKTQEEKERLVSLLRELQKKNL